MESSPADEGGHSGRDNEPSVRHRADGQVSHVEDGPRRVADPQPAEQQRRRREQPVLLLYGRGGGGHLASALAIRDCLTQGHAWDAELLAATGLPPSEGAPFMSAERVLVVDVGKLAEESVLGFWARLVPFSGDDIYNFFLKRGMYNLAALATRFGLGVRLLSHASSDDARALQVLRVHHARARVLITRSQRRATHRCCQRALAVRICK